MMDQKKKSGRVPRWLTAGLVFWFFAAFCDGTSPIANAQVQLSPIHDFVYSANGSAASGSILVSWPAFTTISGQTVPKGTTSVTLATGGRLDLSLAPNTGATPAGTYYTVIYHLDDGSTSREYWSVPLSSSPLTLGSVRTSTLPSSVAMQTASKQYVDQAISRAALGELPQDVSAYVLKSGDTMSGPLTLPSDPSSALQATTKSYVDASTGAVQAGLAQKLSKSPQSTQTVIQPAGTQLEVNNLNGDLYAKQYQSQGGNDGIANALTSRDCSAGCSVVAEPTYTGIEDFTLQANRSHLTDRRGGALNESFFNPHNPQQSRVQGQTINLFETESAQSNLATSHNSMEVEGLTVNLNALGGGNNVYPQNSQSPIPYFKTTYGATQTEGYNTTQGQHVLDNHKQNCYAVGDCLLGSQYLFSSGGYRDNSDEGTHPFDIQIAEHTSLFSGTCSTGCTVGSTQLQVAATSDPGTQGDGRFLIDKAPAKTISSGSLISGSISGPHASVQFSGSAFPVSTFFFLDSTAPAQSNTIAPGTVTVTIRTSSIPAGYSTNTASAPAANGIACIADSYGGSAPDDFETANYSIVDGTHIKLTLLKPHNSGATVAMGGLCGYGIEQTIDTVGKLRQVFPVIGSMSSTSLYYSGLNTKVLGFTNSTSGYANVQGSISTLQRSGNVVTVTVSGPLPVNVNGLSMTVAGVSDASFNGIFNVTTIASNQFTYTQAGANSSSTGGTISLVTGNYALYPMAEVISVFNASTKAVDGFMGLAPNNVSWAQGDPVEQPHYFQSAVAADTTYVTQYLPRPTQPQNAGISYNGVTGAYLQGWVIRNNTPPNTYYGNGGTHLAPDQAIGIQGPWLNAMDIQAGENSGIVMRCNSHGCNRWDSSYNLFALQSSAYYDYLNFAPSTSTLTFNMRGTQYSISPTSLTAGTINAGTVNATRINGLQTATSSAVGGVTLGPSATSAALANVASTGNASDLVGLARSATVDTTNAANITSGTLDPARFPPGSLGGTCASNVAFTATPTFTMNCSNQTFHIPLIGNVTGETFTGLSSGQRITLIFQTGSTPGYTIQWSSSVHGGFLTSSTSSAASYTQAGKYFVQQLVVDTDGVTLLNPGAINE